MLDLTAHLVFPVASHTNYTSSVPHPQASSLPFVTEGSMMMYVGRTDRNTQNFNEIVLFISHAAQVQRISEIFVCGISRLSGCFVAGWKDL